MNCQSRIKREYKTVKAESVWPENGLGRYLDAHQKYPICGGTISVFARIEAVPDWGSTDYSLALEAECSRCQSPFVRGLNEHLRLAMLNNRVDVTAAFESFAAVIS